MGPKGRKYPVSDDLDESESLGGANRRYLESHGRDRAREMYSGTSGAGARNQSMLVTSRRAGGKGKCYISFRNTSIETMIAG